MTALASTSGRARALALAPVAALVGAMVSIQFGSALAEGLFPLVGSQGATTLRLTIGATILAVVMRPWRTRVALRDAPILLGYGATLAAMNLLFYLSIKTIPLGVAVALEFSGPMLVAAAASRRRTDFLWVALAAAGVLLLSPLMRTRQPLDPAGVMYGLGAGACWAIYILFGQRVGRRIGHHATAMGMMIAAVLVLPIGLVHGAALLRPNILLSAVWVGLFSSAVPFSLEMVALTHMETRAYGTLTSVEPGLGAIMGMLLLHQRLSAAQWIGIATVMLAAAGSATTSRAPAVSPQ